MRQHRQTRPFRGRPNETTSPTAGKEVPPPSQALMEHLWERFSVNPLDHAFSGDLTAETCLAAMSSANARLEILTYLQNLADNAD